MVTDRHSINLLFGIGNPDRPDQGFFRPDRRQGPVIEAAAITKAIAKPIKGQHRHQQDIRHA